MGVDGRLRDGQAPHLKKITFITLWDEKVVVWRHKSEKLFNFRDVPTTFWAVNAFTVFMYLPHFAYRDFYAVESTISGRQ